MKTNRSRYVDMAVPASSFDRTATPAGKPESVMFRFHNLEITPQTVIIHFYDERTVFALSEIRSYRLGWHLHDPIFAKKWWFLVLSVELQDGTTESGIVAQVKFNYLNGQQKARRRIAAQIVSAMNDALARSRPNRERSITSACAAA